MDNVVSLAKNNRRNTGVATHDGGASHTTSEPAYDPLAQLLEAAARGDQDAFARLYDLTHGKLYALCFRILRRQDRAEDALQDAYLRIWRWAHRYDPAKGSGFGWIVTVARNVALTSVVRGGREIPSSPELDRREVASTEPDPLEQSMRRQETQALAGCLQRLPQSQQRAITLAYFEGLSHRELADRLDLPLGTAKSAIRRGMMRLRDCLEKVENSGSLEDALAGEYVVGLLRGPARRRFARMRDNDARLCRMADGWEYRLAALVDTLPDAEVDGAVWRRIAQSLPDRSHHHRGPSTMWRSFALIFLAATVLLVLQQIIF